MNSKAAAGENGLHKTYRVLFANCPYGAFFNHLCDAGDAEGVHFERIALDAGDFFEAPKGRRRLYRGSDRDWPAFIEALLKEQQYDALIVWNDALAFNRAATQAADKLGLKWFTLENGYIRPYWVTFEQGGVNGNSALLGGDNRKAMEFQSTSGRVFSHRIRNHVKSAIGHYAYAILLSFAFPYRPNHFGVSDLRKALSYVREYFRRAREDDERFLQFADQTKEKPIGRFLCLLQKPGDTQLEVHSAFSTNNDVLEFVIKSFCKHAPDDAALAFKLHPYDFGIEDTPRLFHNLTRELGVSDRCFLLKETRTSDAIDWSNAIVVNNSSTGLDGLSRGLPVKALGSAIWRQPGMTDEQALDSYWLNPAKPDKTTVEAFVDRLKRTSQINGGFYTEEARQILLPEFLARLKRLMAEAA